MNFIKRVLYGTILLMMAIPHITFAYPTKVTTLKIALLDNFTLELDFGQKLAIAA